MSTDIFDPGGVEGVGKMCHLYRKIGFLREPLTQIARLLRRSTEGIERSKINSGIKSFGAGMVEMCEKSWEKQK
jgi:hypothetical protein